MTAARFNLNNASKTLVLKNVTTADCRDILYWLKEHDNQVTHLSLTDCSELLYPSYLQVVFEIADLIAANQQLLSIELDNIYAGSPVASTLEWLAKIKSNVNITELKIVGNTISQQQLADYLYRNQEIKSAQQIIILDAVAKLLQNADALDSKVAVLLNHLLAKANESSLGANELLSCLKETLSLCQSYPEVETALKKSIELIDTMRTRCIEVNTTPLACAIAKGYADYVAALIQFGANVNSMVDGLPIVFYALNKESIPCLTLLINAGADLNACRPSGKSAVDTVYEQGDRDVIKIVDPTFTEEKFRQWCIKRHFLVGNLSRLFSMFNKDERNQALTKEQGGNTWEGFTMIVPHLEKYVQNSTDDKLAQIYSRFANALIYRDKSIADKLALLKNGETLLFPSGYETHGIGCALYQVKPNEYQLTLVDKGPLQYIYFLDPALESTADRANPIVSITLTEDDLEWALKQLSDIKNGSFKDAQKMLYGIMPDKFGSKWKINHGVLVKIYQTGICFYSNIKALLLSEFVRAYGDDLGYQNYKRFNLFMRQEVVNAYKTLPTKNQDYIQLIEEDLQIKSIGSRQYHRI